ncbi:hypothetical protein [Streptomyces microflavus]|uniref:hypothetical protein n=1 Tax=Streptomyces microflavus TaxID=1919 RepID=UPI00386D52DC|nr:hypothetical protein OG269_36070 [Streptomyces microflavus]WST12740.1 hypothetical protein OG721_01575 [Streptomyces microflavus]
MDAGSYGGSHLPVLRIRLDLAHAVPDVVAELVGYPRGEEHTYGVPLRLPVTEYGLSAECGPPKGAVVPVELLETVGMFMERPDPDVPSGLWLRLVPPCGYLGAVPWERELVPRIRRPVIRVPDLLPAAADPGRVWSVAIVVQAPPHSRKRGPLQVPDHVVRFIGNLRKAIGEGVVVHIFADRDTHEGLGLLLPGSGESGVRTYPVGQAETAGQYGRVSAEARGAGSAEAPTPFLWPDWIASSLRGEAVRALYVVAPAAFDGDRPVLTASPDPQRAADPDDSTYVTAEDLQQLANTVGASTICLGSPEGNPSDAATRLLADGLGRHRAGPTLYSDLGRDPSGVVLAQARAFLNDPAAMEPIPADPSLFGHLQPQHVQALLGHPWLNPDGPDQSWRTGRTSMGDSATSRELAPALDAVPDTERISAHYAGGAAVPTWVAATERYMEMKAAKLLEAAAVPGETPHMKQAYDRGMAQALGELRHLTTQVQDHEGRGAVEAGDDFFRAEEE